VQAQPPADTPESFPDPGELNTDNCFSTALLSQLGVARAPKARWAVLAAVQLYSNIGRRPHLL